MAHQAIAEQTWESAARVQLKTGSSAVVRIDQQTTDLILRVQSQGKTLFEQDGPDLVVGSEFVLLENSREEQLAFDIQVAPRTLGMDVRYHVFVTHDPAPLYEEFARRVSKAHQLWYNSDTADPAVDELITYLQVAQDPSFRLLAFHSLVNAYHNTGQSEAVTLAFERFNPQLGIASLASNHERL